MQRQSKATVAVGMPISRLLSRRHIEIALAYLAGYVLLDWLSYVHPFASFGITPWNPPTGLSFALILLFGAEFLPWLFVAPVLADALVRGLPLPLPAEVRGSPHHRRWICSCHRPAAVFRVFDFDPTLATRTSLLLLLMMAVVTARPSSRPAMWACWSPLASLPAADFARAASALLGWRVIGITVLTPFLLIVATRRWTAQALLGACSACCLVILGALWVVFGLAHTFRFQLFYLFFLPIIWTAVRFGLEGVSTAARHYAGRLITAIHLAEQDAANVTAYQALMVVLAFTGLAVGVLVSEQQRTQRQLRINQEALNRALRLSTMGEFAAALAHEINQPLTAVANYARVAKTATDTDAASEASQQGHLAGRAGSRRRSAPAQLHPSWAQRNQPHPRRPSPRRGLRHCHAELDRHDVRLQPDIRRICLKCKWT